MTGLRIALLFVCLLLPQAYATRCDQAPGADEVVLNETVYYNFVGPEGGEYWHTERTICKEENVQPCEWRYDYSPSQESLEVGGCYVVHDGKTLQCNEPLKRQDVYEWSGTSTMAVSSPSCISGDTYVINVSREYQTTGDDSTCFYAGDYTNQFDYLRLEVEYPLKTKVNYTSSRGSEPTIIENTTKRYIWEWRNLTPPDSEESMPPDSEVFDFVCITGHQNFTSYNKYMRELFESKLAAYEEVGGKAAEIVGNSTGVEAIEKTYRWVRDSIQYVPLEFGPLTNIEPHTPKEVLMRGNGDCKDKSVLLASLLKVQGIEAEPVLFGLDNDKLVTYFFDHVITKIVFENKTIWVDPTCEYCPYGFLPKDEYGKYVMPFVGSDELERLPDYEDVDIYMSLDLDAVVDENGDARLSGKYEIGDAVIASVLRTSFKTASGSAAEDYLSEGLGSLCSDYENLKFDPINLDAENENLLMNLSLDCKGLFKREQNAIVAGSGGDGSLFGNENRTYDYYLGMKMLVRVNMSLTFPEGYNVTASGGGANISTPYYRFFGRRTAEGNRMSVYLETYIANRIPREEYNKLIAAYPSDGLLDLWAEKPAESVAPTTGEPVYIYYAIFACSILAAIMIVLLYAEDRKKRAEKLGRMVDDLVKDGEPAKNIKEVMCDAGYCKSEIETALAKRDKK